MRAREDFDRILAETLSAGWSEEMGRPVRVENGAGAMGQAWRFEPTLCAYFVPGLGRPARRFLRESMQFTPVRWRLPAQWLLAAVVSSRLGLRVSGRPAFAVTPALGGADGLVVIPGNQRVRVFDLLRRRTRVFLKAGFDPEAMRTEIAVRGGGASGPFVPIVASGAAWFEEPIFDGYALPRCPPWIRREGLGAAALDQLDRWLDRSERRVTAAEHASSLAARLSNELRSSALDSGARDQLILAGEQLASRARGLGEVVLAKGHGDFQPGNVLVSRDGYEVTIIDWEHAAERWRPYDRYTWALRGRTGAGLAERLGAVVEGALPAGLPAQPTGRGARQQAAALYVLEDLLWFTHESHAGPYRRISRGLSARIAELPRLLAVTGAGP